MQKHVKNYFKSLNLDPGDNVVCEHPVCWAVAVDIHHIDPRSSFGSKRKAEQDAPDNLVALCRKHHDDAHGPHSRTIREELKEIAKRRVEENSIQRTIEDPNLQGLVCASLRLEAYQTKHAVNAAKDIDL